MTFCKARNGTACEGRAWDRVQGTYQCTRVATVWVGDKQFCWQHDPGRQKQDLAARDAERDARHARDTHRAAIAEQRARVVDAACDLVDDAVWGFARLRLSSVVKKLRELEGELEELEIRLQRAEEDLPRRRRKRRTR